MYGPNVKKCDRGHPIDGSVCWMCIQEDKAQAERDEKLLAQLRRLHAVGKLGPFIQEVLKTS